MCSDGAPSLPAVEVQDLCFTPLPGSPAVLDGLRFSLPTGARCLCIGPNGAGKSTLLQLLSGAKMAGAGQVKVLGHDPFRGQSGADTILVSGGWRGASSVMSDDRMAALKVAELLGCAKDDITSLSERERRLHEVMEIGPLLDRFLGVLSEGERCRVELVRQLRQSKKVILLDEVTAELDMLVRKNLLDFLASEQDSTVLNVTHVFEGLGTWASHVLHIQEGKLVRCEPMPQCSQGVFEQVAAWLSVSRNSFSPAQRVPYPRLKADGPAIMVSKLQFLYDNDVGLQLDELSLPGGCRCVLVGLNGSGKSSLLSIIAGRRMVTSGEVQVLGMRAFHDFKQLDSNVAILSSEWKRQVAELVSARALSFKELADTAMKELVGAGFEMQVLAARLLRLIQMLAIDPAKPIGILSDGAMRRVQIALKLMRPAAVLLVDEVTADLDVLARQALLTFLREESEEGCAIVYCTHIMDGLDGWATHLLHMRPAGFSGHLVATDEFAVQGRRDGASALSSAVISMLREDLDAKREVDSRPKSKPRKTENEIELPTGWAHRSVGRSGAFGNYAWQEEDKPEEDWSFKSVAPTPPAMPSAQPSGSAGMPGGGTLGGIPGLHTGMPGILPSPVLPAPGVPGIMASPGISGVSSEMFPGQAGAAGYSGAGVLPDAKPVPDVRIAPTRTTADDSCPWGAGERQNQLSQEQLVRRGLLTPEQ